MKTRPIEPADLPAVVDLYRQINEGARRRPADEVERKLGAMAIDQPRPAAIHSLVQRTEERVVGFMGIVPRTWKFGDERVIGVGCTGFVVDPNHRDGLASARLAKGAMGQGQTLTLADRPTDVAVRIFTAMRGFEVPHYGFDWRWVLRPGTEAQRQVTARYRDRGFSALVRAAASAAAPLVRAVDRRGEDGGEPTWPTEPLDLSGFIHAQAAVAAGYTLCLCDDEAGAAWVWQYLGDYPSRGQRTGAVVLDPDSGDPVGWYIVYERPDAPWEVVAMAALPDAWGPVVAAMGSRCRQAGAVALVGVASSTSLRPLLAAGARAVSAQRLVVHTKRPEIAAAFREGQALLTGLEAEVWV